MRLFFVPLLSLTLFSCSNFSKKPIRELASSGFSELQFACTSIKYRGESGVYSGSPDTFLTLHFTGENYNLRVFRLNDDSIRSVMISKNEIIPTLDAQTEILNTTVSSSNIFKSFPFQVDQTEFDYNQVKFEKLTSPQGNHLPDGLSMQVKFKFSKIDSRNFEVGSLSSVYDCYNRL